MNGTFLEGSWHEGAPPSEAGAIVVTGQRPPPTTEDAIVVTGTRDAPAGYFLFNAAANGFYSDEVIGVSAGSNNQALTYSTAHDAIGALHAELALKSDRNTKEHFAIVYKDATGYHTSPLFTGNALEGNLALLFNWMARNAVDLSEVVSLYHNHDSYEYGLSSDSADANRYPSNNDGHGRGDWPTADFFVHPGGGLTGADPSIFVLTLEDVDHAVRDFSYSQESTYVSLTRDQRISGDQIPSAQSFN